ncbi:MAG: heme-dependent peroxidase [Myxococcaceae bacterium]|nr:heme-dependent peroxidase [Myxococcaceae bacterium]MBH2005828.1 heme-dependent peroxidase [Myxococcaceae bacterium]
MSGKMVTLEGWYILHDFRRFDQAQWRQLSDAAQEEIQSEFSEILESFERVNSNRSGAFGLYQILGHQADYLFLNLRTDLHELSKTEQRLQKSRLFDFLVPTYSYVSVVELSNYVSSESATSPEVQALLDARLKPALPDLKHVCFYPMSKSRAVGANWYLEPLEERRRMMKEHGSIGRTYAGKVLQMIGGSIGFDDWEWGVTLFSDDPLHFKHLVTEMRFDEASARFAEFGTFYLGNRISLADLNAGFKISKV